MVAKVCSRPAVVLGEGGRVTEAARLMHERNVGAVVIVDGRRPLGIVTDRDIVTRVVAEGRDPERAMVGEIMTRDPAVVHEDAAVCDALKICGAEGIRRLPVVSREGDLIGMVTLDDLLRFIGNEMGQVVSAVARAQAEPYEYVPL